jgi:hypothetical protein
MDPLRIRHSAKNVNYVRVYHYIFLLFHFPNVCVKICQVLFAIKATNTTADHCVRLQMWFGLVIGFTEHVRV